MVRHFNRRASWRVDALLRTLAIALPVVAAACGDAQLTPPPDTDTDTAAVSPPSADREIRASGVFAGPNQYPPGDFAAYGILAFQSEATSASRDRYLAICEGFLASLPSAGALEDRGIPLDQQMATVWPLDDGVLADELNAAAGGITLFDRCQEIVASIDTITSGEAIALASGASGDVALDGDGPYLLAWSPSSAYGQTGVLVLMADLSNVTTVTQATRQFTDWRTNIQLNPELWSNGWDVERVRTTIGQWADRYGSAILRLLGIEGA